MMKLLTIASLALLVLPLMTAAQQPHKVFPYAYSIDDLPNGLRLVTVPTDYPNLVSLYIVVQAGSRNEIEAGKSGYAHFFEHLMFRGSEHFSSEDRDKILKNAGAASNAYTADDRTVYHEAFAKEDLPKVMELEADRFLRLKYSENQFKTESLAVLGEYNKNSANPISKLFEVLRETAFKTHTYAHTTMGYVRDIEDYPNAYDYSWQFWKRFYRPEYATIVIVGDVTRAQALALTQQHFGAWQKGDYVAKITPEPEQTEARTANIDWPSSTLPHLVVAFRGPAYSDTSKDKAALDLLGVVAFSSNSDLYQQLVLKEQKVTFVTPNFDNQVDPEMFAVFAQIRKPEDVNYVRDQILATFKRYATELIPKDKLNATRANLRYSFALQMDSSEAIAGALAPYIALRRTPESIDKVFDLYDHISPEEIRDIAARYFRDNNRTIVTLQTKKNAGGEE